MNSWPKTWENGRRERNDLATAEDETIEEEPELTEEEEFALILDRLKPHARRL